MKYRGSWSANKGNTIPAYEMVYQSNNKRDLAKQMMEIALGNTYVGNTGKWAVYRKPNYGEPILSGSVTH